MKTKSSNRIYSKTVEEFLQIIKDYYGINSIPIPEGCIHNLSDIESRIMTLMVPARDERNPAYTLVDIINELNSLDTKVFDKIKPLHLLKYAGQLRKIVKNSDPVLNFLKKLHEQGYASHIRPAKDEHLGLTYSGQLIKAARIGDELVGLLNDLRDRGIPVPLYDTAHRPSGEPCGVIQNVEKLKMFIRNKQRISSFMDKANATLSYDFGKGLDEPCYIYAEALCAFSKKEQEFMAFMGDMSQRGVKPTLYRLLINYNNLLKLLHHRKAITTILHAFDWPSEQCCAQEDFSMMLSFDGGEKMAFYAHHMDGILHLERSFASIGISLPFANLLARHTIYSQLVHDHEAVGEVCSILKPFASYMDKPELMRTPPRRYDIGIASFMPYLKELKHMVDSFIDKNVCIDPLSILMHSVGLEPLLRGIQSGSISMDLILQEMVHAPKQYYSAYDLAATAERLRVSKEAQNMPRYDNPGCGA